MGKSIRSKIKRKYRAQRAETVNALGIEEEKVQKKQAVLKGCLEAPAAHTVSDREKKGRKCCGLHQGRLSDFLRTVWCGAVCNTHASDTDQDKGEEESQSSKGQIMEHDCKEATSTGNFSFPKVKQLTKFEEKEADECTTCGGDDNPIRLRQLIEEGIWVYLVEHLHHVDPHDVKERHRQGYILRLSAECPIPRCQEVHQCYH
eukprot:scaffold25_cov342-Pavlova_lutheri.AAC.56